MGYIDTTISIYPILKKEEAISPPPHPPLKIMSMFLVTTTIYNPFFVVYDFILNMI